ncbi:MAG: xanthine dehydrogenase family protein molybdopterin-binding subunit [Deltaproteobacteria bacterium]|nr:MAG: xanthine dehydrogenase family protein molybdopterin-binding subunit [Deltaproteobacteria bacterium]
MNPKEPRLEDIPASERRWIGKHVERLEDPQLVTGRTKFIDNVTLPDMVHCAMLRSPHAHARIRSIDTSRAEALPGVVAVVTGRDVLERTQPMGGFPEGTGAYCMATEKATYVGEPVAAVAAVDRATAEDATELIEVDYEVLPAVVDGRQAMQPDAPIVIESLGTNVPLHRTFTWGDVDAAFASADHVFEQSFRWHRMGANPIETFGCICQWDTLTGEVTVHGSVQSPRLTALAVAGVLGVPSNKLRLISYQRGGSFGGKGNPRAINIVCLLSLKAGGLPVKWIEDRMEYLMAGASQAWDRYYEAQLAVRSDGTVTGLRIKLIDDLGANGENYGSLGAGKPLAAFTGCYKIPVASYEVALVLTNKLPTSAYRGMGPPPHFFVLEQMMDVAARGLGLDPAEIRRRNYIQPDEFPYTIASGNEYDSGNYPEALDQALELAGYEDLRRRQVEERARGRYLGIGVVNTIEPGVFDWNSYAIVGMPGVGVAEGVTVSIDVVGKITVRIGFTTEGQGHYTLAAQLLADYFGVDLSDVHVVPLDTLSAPPAFGPGGSRLGVAMSGAIMGAAEKLKAKLVAIAAHLMQAPPEAVVLSDGKLKIPGVEGAEMSLAEVAGVALARSDLLPPGMELGLEATSVWTAKGRNPIDDQGRAKSYLTAANACHVVLIEVDVETGRTSILKYVVVDDCGNRLNPATVEGMTQGGIAQGIGAALLEEYPYDEEGQPLATTFMDYLLPTIHEIPVTEKRAIVTPSPVAPLGAKGCGEGAIHTAPAAVLCAINDALAPLGVMVREVPASPSRLWELLREAGAGETKNPEQVRCEEK